MAGAQYTVDSRGAAASETSSRTRPPHKFTVPSATKKTTNKLKGEQWALQRIVRAQWRLGCTLNQRSFKRKLRWGPLRMLGTPEGARMSPAG